MRGRDPGRRATRKRKPSARDKARTPLRPERRILAMIQVLTLIFVVVVGVALIRTWLLPAEATVPAELVGVWRAANERYADRALEFTPTGISFGTGDSGTHRFEIVSVDRELVADGEWYTVEFGSRRQPQQVTFFYRRTPTQQITLRNQPNIVWRKR